jgi:hypothetical protein
MRKRLKELSLKTVRSEIGKRMEDGNPVGKGAVLDGFT